MNDIIPVANIAPGKVPGTPMHHIPFAFFTLFTTVYISLIFLVGAALLKWRVSLVWNDFTVLVPPVPSLTSCAVSSFSDGCIDLRREAWRLFTYSLLHAGFFHYFCNMLALCSYGIVIEVILFLQKSPWLRAVQCFLAFQVGVIWGALGNAYEFPYSSLCGCSAGIYGLIGLAWSLLISSSTTQRQKLTLVILLVAQLICDITMFVGFFNPNLGYVAHFSGFLAGISMGLLFEDNGIKFCFGLSLFLSLSVFLLHSYLTSFPPAFHVNPTFGNSYSRHSCCLDAIRIIKNDATMSMQKVTQNWICQGSLLVPR